MFFKKSVLWALIFPALQSYAQKTGSFIVPLKTVIDTGGLHTVTLVADTDTLSMNYDASRHFTGLPASLKVKMIKQIEFQPAQSLFECYLRYWPNIPATALTSELARYKVDTMQLSRKPIKHMVYLVTGIDDLGRRVIIVDANNNYDFSDDKIAVYDSAFLKKSYREIESSVENNPVHFQYVSNGKVYDRTCNLKFTPVDRAFTYRDPLEEKLKVLGNTNEIMQGSFSAGSNKYTFYALSGNRNVIVYDSLTTLVKIIEKDGKGNVTANQQYRIGDTVLLDTKRYLLRGISELGDSLKLFYLGKGAVVYGIDSGKIAFNIVTTDMNGNPFDLQKFRGKYVLVDFWGSWCKPCLESIPDLTEISVRYKNDLQVVSIDLDKPDKLSTVKRLIKDLEMNWINIHQDDSDPAKKGIVIKYQVEHFPTQILIDPNGKIVFRIIGANRADYVKKVLDAAIGKSRVTKAN